jgi:hypothetical protein
MFTAADDQGHFDQIPFIPTFAFSFPASESAPGIDYVVRNSYWQQEEDDEDEI